MGTETREGVSRIAKMIEGLPPELQQEVADFAEFLLQKQARKPGRPLSLNWRGALRDLRGQYTSVELQHKALEWWGD